MEQCRYKFKNVQFSFGFPKDALLGSLNNKINDKKQAYSYLSFLMYHVWWLIENTITDSATVTVVRTQNLDVLIVFRLIALNWSSVFKEADSEAVLYSVNPKTSKQQSQPQLVISLYFVAERSSLWHSCPAFLRHQPVNLTALAVLCRSTISMNVIWGWGIYLFFGFK